MENIKELLEEYNPHWQRSFSYDLILRENYTNQLKSFIDRREIVVLKGIRRSGKSSLLKLMINFLIRKQRIKSTQILFMNLEDYRFGSEKTSAVLEEILQTYIELCSPKGRFYVFFDEIQEVQEFEKMVKNLL